MAFKNLLLAFSLPLIVFAWPAFSAEKNITAHYQLIISRDDAICKPITKLYNKFLIHEIQKHKLNIATDFEINEPEKFAEIMLVEPPTKEIELPSPQNSMPATYKTYVDLVDFFKEGKPRIVQYSQLLQNGGMTESTEIVVLKKDAEYKTVQLDASNTGVAPNLIDWKLEAKRNTTARIFINSNQPYFIVNNYTLVPGQEENKLMVYKLDSNKILDEVCNISLGNQ